MFPHSITIYRHSTENGRDVYTRYVLPGVYWYGAEAITAKGNGSEQAGSVTVLIPKKHADTLGKRWSVACGDLCVLGVAPVITLQKELFGLQTIKVLSVEVNRCGSDLDNVCIKGA